MTAIKAKYHNGKLDWEKPPPFTGSYDLTVYFDPEGSTPEEKRRAEDILWAWYKNIAPPKVSVVDELIADRRREAALDEQECAADMGRLFLKDIPRNVSLINKLAAEQQPKSTPEEKRRAAESLWAYYKNIAPPDVSLVDELIAERRREAARDE